MFKKIFVIFLLWFSPFAVANTDNDVQIKITNATGSDCILKKQLSLYGDLVQPSDLSMDILRDQSIMFTMKSDTDSNRKAILLAYDCNDDFSATFLTDVAPFQGMLVSSSRVLNAQKIHLYFTEDYNESGQMYNHSPIKVSWRLTR